MGWSTSVTAPATGAPPPRVCQLGNPVPLHHPLPPTIRFVAIPFIPNFIVHTSTAAAVAAHSHHRRQRRSTTGGAMTAHR